jgi:beta-N-acetylhexosaminidase
MPFRSAVNNGVGSVMVAHISLPQIDPTEIKPLEKAIRPAYVDEGGEIVVEKATMPASLSPVVNTQILRREMNFNGLIVTDAMDMSGLTLYFNQDEAAVRAILAGADIILKPADADAAIRGLREAVKSGRISEDRLNESVKRLLIAKYELGLVEKRLVAVDEIDKSVAGKETRELAEEIAAKAITLVRNEEQTLPLKKSQSKSSVFVLAVTNGDDRYFVANTFLQTLRQNGINFDAAVLDERSSEAELKNALAKAGKAELVIAPLYGRVRTGSARSVGLPESSEKLLRQLLDENKKVVGISFGNPYLLQEFPKMKTYLVAYGDMASLQRAAARSILGQQEIQGRLPINLPGLVPIGTGLNYNKQQ